MPHKRDVLLAVTFFGLIFFFMKNSSISRMSIPENQISWNDTGPQHVLWPDDEHCSQFVTRFAAGHSLPTRALVSYPGSGNTWLRYLIEAATGVFTGSIYNDKVILASGHLGEGVDYRDGTTILQKTHHIKTGDTSKRLQHIEIFEGRAVLVVRNPYKAIISSWNYAKTHSHTESADTNNQEFLIFAEKQIYAWLQLISDWVENSTELHCLFYENLKKDPLEEMRKLLRHLSLPIDEGRLYCIHKHNSQKFQRAHNNTDGAQIFPQKLRIVIDETIVKASNLISLRTGESLPVKKYEGFRSKL